MTGAQDPPPILTVGAVVAGTRRLLDERVGRIWVVGEVSNLRQPASGHLYFTLKDADAQLRAALFRGTARRLAFEPQDGLEVLVYGDLTVYEARGELQLVVRELEPRGAGALQVAFEQLRRRLEAEGLFDPARKRPLPRVPRRVGLVTSASGAALRDVLEVARRRLPGMALRLASCRVQGRGAEQEVARALHLLARHGDVDVILVVRGGGSLEDLQAFNSEELARAISDCSVPVVSGVGHEIDITIADLVADERAPTPSAAAELAIPERGALLGELGRRRDRLTRGVGARIEVLAGAWRSADAALRARHPAQRVSAGGERLHSSRRALDQAFANHLERARADLARRATALGSLSPLSVLGRGYALVRRSSDGVIVRDLDDAPVGERLDVRTARADLEVRVEAGRVREPASGGSTDAPSPRR